MAKFLKALLSEQSRGSITRGIATVSIGEVAEPPPPAVIDNRVFYETWHCVWHTPNMTASYVPIKSVNITNFKRGYEYMVYALQYDSDAEIGVAHFFVPEETDTFGRDSMAFGCLDGEIYLNVKTGVLIIENGVRVNLLKIICRPIRVIGSEAERKYPTDWVKHTISTVRSSNFNFSQDTEYQGFTSHRSTPYFYTYRCFVLKDMVRSDSYVKNNIGITSYQEGKWVDFLASNHTTNPVKSGKIECSDSKLVNQKYLYSRPVVVSSGTVDTEDYHTWKKVFWNTKADSKSLSITTKDHDQLLILQGDFKGTDEMGSGVIKIDKFLESHKDFDVDDGYSVVTGPDSWVRYISTRSLMKKQIDGGMYAVLKRSTRLSSTACSTTAAVPNITIPSEGG